MAQEHTEDVSWPWRPQPWDMPPIEILQHVKHFRLASHFVAGSVTSDVTPTRPPRTNLRQSRATVSRCFLSPCAVGRSAMISHPPLSCDSLKHVKHQHLEASILSCWFLSVVSVQWCAFRVLCFRLDAGRGMVLLGRLSKCSFGEQTVYIYLRVLLFQVSSSSQTKFSC